MSQLRTQLSMKTVKDMLQFVLGTPCVLSYPAVAVQRRTIKNIRICSC